MTDPRDWIAVSLLPGIGARTLQKLRAAGADPVDLVRAPHSVRDICTLPSRLTDLIDQYRQQKGRIWQRVCASESWLAATPDAACIPFNHADYPRLLREIADPPALLYLRGSPAALTLPQMAMVGSRNASESGLRHAYQFASELSDAGLVMTSGLALGIDGRAHQAAVDNGHATLAVTGCGLDKVYPKRHSRLAEQILEYQGALISEYPPGTPPVAANFPRRNRIISGMSLGVLVVEASLRSGSLITARLALEQGREVFAIPGSIHNPQVRGCHALIREGAVLVETLEDIIQPLAPLLGVLSASVATQIPSGSANFVQASTPALNPLESQLLKQLGDDILSPDQLAELTGLGAAELLQGLTGLELKGIISAVPGGYQRQGRSGTLN